YDQRLELVNLMWELAWADGSLDPLEEHRIRRLADLLTSVIATSFAANSAIHPTRALSITTLTAKERRDAHERYAGSNEFNRTDPHHGTDGAGNAQVSVDDVVHAVGAALVWAAAAVGRLDYAGADHW
ncbi:hypothetical protein DK37_29530, partial [Halomonas sp. SUBG004]